MSRILECGYRAPKWFALLFLVFVSLSCGDAEGVAQDPVELEAEEAFVAYLRIDTTNPPGNETSGATYLRDLLVKDGIEARLIGDDPKRQAVYARLRSDATPREKALLLLSHIDVVPADPTLWRNPPFSGKREGGYIWGRGALDIKSLTIAQLMACVDLKRRGAKLRRDVIFLAVPDEELGGTLGAKKLLEQYPALFEDVGFVLNEGGSNETAVDKVLFWGIEVQQKIPLWLRITSEAGGGHGAAGAAHGGATAKLIRALSAVDAIETPYRLVDMVARTAAMSAAVRKDGGGQRLRALREPLDVAFIERELPAGYRALLRDTITITRLSAGNAVNSVPSRAFAEVDIRLLPDSSPSQSNAASNAMLARVREAVGQNATVEVILAGEPTPESPSSGELYDALSRVFRASAPGSTVGPLVSPGTTDSRFFRARGIVAYGIAPFKVNYYDADGVHGNDEKIRTRFFSEGVGVMRKIVREFCERPAK
ncbi:MAG: M20/M25/M40 family metallo-hydrolase [Acidobacteriota bacterium]|nr:M20/M25/M40 family metallo-hydrolase [Acidobacteriota bacterium]